MWTTLNTLLDEDFTFDVTSTNRSIMDDITQESNHISLLLPQVTSLDPYQGIMFLPGNLKDMEDYWINPRVLNLVTLATQRTPWLPMAALGTAVPIIRGAIKHHEVSYYPLIRICELVEQSGARTSPLPLERDGQLVTAYKDTLAQLWTEEFVALLLGQPYRHPPHTLEALPEHTRMYLPEMERMKLEYQLVRTPLKIDLNKIRAQKLAERYSKE